MNPKPGIRPHRVVAMAALTGLMLLLTACGQQPAAREVGSLLQQQFNDAGLESLVSVRYLEIREREILSDRRQNLSIQYELEFLQDFDEAVAALADDTDQRGLSLNTLEQGIAIGGLRIRFGEFKQGEMLFQRDEIEVVKVGEEWRLGD